MSDTTKVWLERLAVSLLTVLMGLLFKWLDPAAPPPSPPPDVQVVVHPVPGTPGPPTVTVEKLNK